MSDFWDRNWAVAEALGEPTPPNKSWNAANIPIYCSVNMARATDPGWDCVCGCSTYLRAQRKLAKKFATQNANAELPVMAWVKPKRGTPEWEALKQEVVKYHTGD